MPLSPVTDVDGLLELMAEIAERRPSSVVTWCRESIIAKGDDLKNRRRTSDEAISQMQRPPLLDGLLERTATRFLRRIHRVTHRMPVKLRAIEKQRVLVVAPHPDDEVIPVGGNLALHQCVGSEVL